MQTHLNCTGPIPRDPHIAGFARWFLCLLFAISIPSVIGCKPNKRYDLIEAELRTRERELEDTRVALEQSRNLNRAYAQQAANASQPVTANTPTYVPVKEITLARGTGGISGGGPSGDDGLMVVVVPRDEDGAAVKVPARVEIAAWDITPAGLKNPIGNWAIPPEKVRPTWRNGFISTGFFVAVPWQTYPTSERVRVAVRLVTLDGRAFETDRDIHVKLGPGGSRIEPLDPPQPAPVLPVPQPLPVPAPAPVRPREPLFPDPLPPGHEELPVPKGAPGRAATLLPPQKD
jgi:hypothetical protein